MYRQKYLKMSIEKIIVNGILTSQIVAHLLLSSEVRSSKNDKLSTTLKPNKR